MKRVSFILACFLVLTLLPGAAWAGSFTAIVSGGLHVSASGKFAAPVALGSLVILSGSGSMEGFGSGGFQGPTYLVVDATPLEAQVFLDGRLLGTARELLARGLPLPPGRHAIEIVAPGFRPYIAQFTAGGGFPVRFRVALFPE